jgi:eukaryotic-like serine/threonine-protein kinase
MINSPTVEILINKYQIIDILGRGGVGITYRARDIKTERIVAIKALSLKRAKDWKAIELFDREAKILSQLNHPAIPEYIDHFQVDSEIDRQYYIVQTLAEGESLFDTIASGWKPTIDEVKDIASQVLQILSYLHALNPPVIHRDIKPQNLIRNAEGKIYLVDFGAVQDTFYTVMGGSTVVGTYGYMAPEQFRGQAYLSTDLYGLGTTLLYLLTGTDPAVLPQKKLKLDFSNLVSLPADFTNWLDRLLEPEPQRRFATVELALAVLDGRSHLPALPIQQPAFSKIKLDRIDDFLAIEIPPVGLSNVASRRLGLLVGVWNGLLLIILFYAITLRLFIDPTKQLFFIGFGIVGLWLMVKFLYGSLSRVVIQFDGYSPRATLRECKVTITKYLLNSKYEYKNFTADLYLVSNLATAIAFAFVPFGHSLQLQTKSQKYSIAQLLTPAENSWLKDEIASYIANITSPCISNRTN